MIELRNDRLVFSFPDVHADAEFAIDFQRTLRIPDDDTDYSLPPGLGRFPVRHVDDFARSVPARWLDHGGVMLPMYQSEALWLNFSRGGADFSYPFAVKIATGKRDAITGRAWSDGLHGKQDYVVIPKQPWLDGYCVEKGIIRQFVAMPLGAGYSAEEQITGEAEHGGIQVIAYPMRRDAYERRRKEWEASPRSMWASDVEYCAPAFLSVREDAYDMGLAPGGRMRQEIYDDPYELDEWDTGNASRCFIHIANSMVWRAITGTNPPTTPPTAKEYTNAGLPWFEYYGGDAKALDGAGTLAGLKSVVRLGKEKGDVPLPENEPVTPGNIVHLRSALTPEQVREGRF